MLRCLFDDCVVHNKCRHGCVCGQGVETTTPDNKATDDVVVIVLCVCVVRAWRPPPLTTRPQMMW